MFLAITSGEFSPFFGLFLQNLKNKICKKFAHRTACFPTLLQLIAEKDRIIDYAYNGLIRSAFKPNFSIAFATTLGSTVPSFANCDNAATTT